MLDFRTCWHETTLKLLPSLIFDCSNYLTPTNEEESTLLSNQQEQWTSYSKLLNLLVVSFFILHFDGIKLLLGYGMIWIVITLIMRTKTEMSMGTTTIKPIIRMFISTSLMFMLQLTCCVCVDYHNLYHVYNKHRAFPRMLSTSSTSSTNNYEYTTRSRRMNINSGKSKQS